MVFKKFRDVVSQPVTGEGAQKISIRVLIGEGDGAKNFNMRFFEIEPGGNSPLHRHPWEHEVFIVSGRGTLQVEGGEIELETWDVVFVEPGELHSFRADPGEGLKFVCCVPQGVG